jgi:hypothetical protein
MSPVKGCADDARQKLKSTHPTSRQRGVPHQQTRNCLKKIIKEKLGKIDRGCQMGA